MEITEQKLRQERIFSALTKIYAISDGLESNLSDMHQFSQALRNAADFLRYEFEKEGVIEKVR